MHLFQSPRVVKERVLQGRRRIRWLLQILIILSLPNIVKHCLHVCSGPTKMTGNDLANRSTMKTKHSGHDDALMEKLGGAAGPFPYYYHPHHPPISEYHHHHHQHDNRNYNEHRHQSKQARA